MAELDQHEYEQVHIKSWPHQMLKWIVDQYIG